MKTAEEWAKEYERRFCDLNVEADEKVGEGVVPFEDIHAIIIRAIQLDAMKEGMRRAAEVADNRIKHAVVPKITRAILTTAEQLTTKDL